MASPLDGRDLIGSDVPLSNISFSAFRARPTRLFTVPTGIFESDAASSWEKPPTPTRIKASRCGSDKHRIAQAVSESSSAQCCSPGGAAIVSSQDVIPRNLTPVAALAGIQFIAKNGKEPSLEIAARGERSTSAPRLRQRLLGQILGKLPTVPTRTGRRPAQRA